MCVNTGGTSAVIYFKLKSYAAYWGCRDSGDKRQTWRTVSVYERCSALSTNRARTCTCY